MVLWHFGGRAIPSRRPHAAPQKGVMSSAVRNRKYSERSSFRQWRAKEMESIRREFAEQALKRKRGGRAVPLLGSPECPWRWPAARPLELVRRESMPIRVSGLMRHNPFGVPRIGSSGACTYRA